MKNNVLVGILEEKIFNGTIFFYLNIFLLDFSNPEKWKKMYKNGIPKEPILLVENEEIKEGTVLKILEITNLGNSIFFKLDEFKEFLKRINIDIIITSGDKLNLKKDFYIMDIKEKFKTKENPYEFFEKKYYIKDGNIDKLFFYLLRK